MIVVNIGNTCTQCGEDTEAGSGSFINRIPSLADAILVLEYNWHRINVTVDGYMCPACQEYGEEEEIDCT